MLVLLQMYTKIDYFAIEQMTRLFIVILENIAYGMSLSNFQGTFFQEILYTQTKRVNKKSTNTLLYV